MNGSAPVLLTGYDVKRCQRRVHNDRDATLDRVPWEVPADLQKRFDDGHAFEDKVFAAWQQALESDRWRVVRTSDEKAAAVAATLAAMQEGVELIFGGWLPDDVEGGRTGRPDLLLRVGGGYVPGDVKMHKTVRSAPKGTLRYSTLDAPADVLETGWLAPRLAERRGDCLQLAHYWRMLEASGFTAASPARGFVVGTDGLVDLDGTGLTLTWFDLEVPAFVTFSRSQGKAKRTALEHYDFEHAIRLDIARTAVRRTGSTDDPEPLVQPVFTDECGTCPWHDHCLEIAGDLASASITTGRLDVREWRALDRLGVTTRDQLCGLDVESWPRLDDYLLEVTHQSRPAERLHTAVRRARMARDGVRLARETTGAIDVPRADVEIDFDLEDAEGRVYLWGALVTGPEGASAYVPHVSWQPLDELAERALAEEFVSWLREQRDAAANRGHSTLAFHYTGHELIHLRRILGAEAIADLTPMFVDLYPVVTEHYFGASGLGLKQVAQHFGFAWRDEEPNGLLSQLWYLEAVGDDPVRADAARRRLLDYNEDDVRATLATRTGMTNDLAPG